MSRRIDLDKRARWAMHFGLFAAGGLSVRDFCRRHGLSEARFYWWRRRLAAGGPEGGPLFVPVRVIEAGGDAALAERVGIGPARRHPLGRVESGRVESGRAESGRAESGRIDLLLGGGVTVRLRGEVPAARLATVLDVLGRRGGVPC